MSRNKSEAIEISVFDDHQCAVVSVDGLELGHLRFGGPHARQLFIMAFARLKALEDEKYQEFTCEVKVEEVEPETEFEFKEKRYVMLHQDDAAITEEKSRLSYVYAYGLDTKHIGRFVCPGAIVKVADGTLIGKDESATADAEPKQDVEEE